jgi:hypothetical protein
LQLAASAIETPLKKVFEGGNTSMYKLKAASQC